MFRKLDLFPSSGEEWKTPTQLGPFERALSKKGGNTYSVELLRNVFSIF
jgi:hypothetical protein